MARWFVGWLMVGWLVGWLVGWFVRSKYLCCVKGYNLRQEMIRRQINQRRTVCITCAVYDPSACFLQLFKIMLFTLN